MNKFVGIGLGIVAAGSLAGNALMFQRYSSAKPVVSMGSDAVSIKDFRDRLEVVSGKQVLTKMVLRSIVMTEAKAKGVAGVPPLAQIRPHVERQFKLQQAAIQGRTKQVVLAELYSAKHPTIEVSKYSPWFTELENASANLQKGVKTANK